jgi:glycerol-3-phosphate dehydrogenase (NAD(P)+)
VKQQMAQHIAVLGAGAWGVALANVAAQNHNSVLLWGRNSTHIEILAQEGENPQKLPGLFLNPTINTTTDLATIRSANIILGVVPAQSMRAVARLVKQFINKGTTFIICAKGLEIGSKKFMSEIVSEELPETKIAVLSGPSFALDVCNGLPTAVTLASSDEDHAQFLCSELSVKNHRLYRSMDVRGVEIGGAAKNVFAIAAGLASGRLLGASAQAALIARSFAELMRLGRRLGAQQETLMGLSGLGDLVLTCGSAQSRNFALGEALGRGITLSEAKKGKLVEGAYTASVLVELALANNIDMPIVNAVNAILTEKMTIEESIETLLMRPLRSEI